MKRLIILTIIAAGMLLANSEMSARKANPDYDGPKPEAIKGAKALLFNYTPFQSSFNPVNTGLVHTSPADDIDMFVPVGGIGFKAFFDDNFSAAIGIGISMSTESNDEENPKTTDSDFLAGLSLSGNYHFTALYSVSPYIGGEFSVGYSSISRKETFTQNTTERVTSGMTFGVAGVVGFDWYFTEGLAIGGKYTLGFFSLPDPTLEITTGENTTETEGATRTFFGTGIGSVVLTVHI